MSVDSRSGRGSFTKRQQKIKVRQILFGFCSVSSGWYIVCSTGVNALCVICFKYYTAAFR